MRIISWYSAGAASAVSTMLAIKDHKKVDVVNIEIKEEHPDNKRFLSDCEKWFGQKIKTVGNDKYNRSIFEVFKQTKYMAGVGGAACTRLLKKEVRKQYEKPGDIQVFGYTSEEQHRVDRFIDANNDVEIITPLIDRGLTKQDCLAIVQDAGIGLPTLYKQGFKNNKCIPCVKGGAGYHKLMQKHYAEASAKMNSYEKLLNVNLLKCTVNGEVMRYKLDEIPSHIPMQDDSVDIQCGVFCQIAEGELF